MRLHKVSATLMPHFRAQQTQFDIVRKKQDQMNIHVTPGNGQAS